VREEMPFLNKFSKILGGMAFFSAAILNVLHAA
jgi:hypothetical protein